MSIKPLLLVAGLTLSSPLAFAAETGSGLAKDEAVGFGYLTYGLTDITTWIAFAALVAFLAIVWFVGGFKIIFDTLDKRAATIRAQLEEAKSLREEAAKSLAAAERKAKEADQLAEDIVKRAKADADTMMKQAQADLETKMARREAQAEARIARAEADAEADVRRAAADAATAAARDILAKAKETDDLFDHALGEIESRLN